MWLFWLLTALTCRVQAKAVFAHFMVTNSENYTLADWESDISLAVTAHIDAFALNIAVGDTANSQLANAFTAADSLDFKLFISFDYAGNGAWSQDEVYDILSEYIDLDAYYITDDQPLVSTFEGPANAADWTYLKEYFNCMFIPDWSSLGAKAALELGTADGLFSWAAWPWGDTEMNTYTDASYIQYLDDLPYMMAVSPWFFTNLPGYNKNWLWRGDHLWYERWNQVLFLDPPFVEIISWNDYGESHYIGPLRDYAFAAFSIGEAPYNYADEMPHDGWRAFLPYMIDLYKEGTATITQEGIVAWYRVNPKTACDTGDTSGNTASELQLEFEPYDIVDDEIMYSALLGSTADVTVTVGDTELTGAWTSTPDGGIGIYHGSVSFSGLTGDVTVVLSRDGASLATVAGKAITSDCTDDIENWNAWVGSALSSATVSATPALSVSDQVCVNGTGWENFEGICGFACEYGYCPVSACTCNLMGAQKTAPNATGVEGYPIAGEDASYDGLCSYDCNHGYCPPSACSTVSAALSTPTVSDFTLPRHRYGSIPAPASLVHNLQYHLHTKLCRPNSHGPPFSLAFSGRYYGGSSPTPVKK
ncbi:hypothetical protein ASPZODRAFT_77659 [Penicilliopsis zonata CBS 506.65]|uniref:Uncharacterized protein n=1 Tax=Penicilliopsis zonata CBS 506.65 TaxID=1073090 RepID=A0A1L9S4M6_9EURO|nr:hypothetical protein ASPZODRAFT_77659 [Penicilliopsis zonata CBS 506.65]OJJ42117.1 hypothetical protein ASPZODRAFT_77659 [Penicilliopsis zonata CBS 506.65]